MSHSRKAGAKTEILSLHSLCNTKVLYFTVTTEQSLFTLQVVAGQQLFIAQ